MKVSNYEKYDYKLLKRASHGDCSVLKDSRVAKARDYYRNTCLHLLAKRGVVDVLKHPKVSKVKNLYGDTPLHYLAERKTLKILGHPDVDKVVNHNKKTPLEVLTDYLNYNINKLRLFLRILKNK